MIDLIMDTKIKQLLALAAANKASDIHLISGSWPKLRVNGQLMDVGSVQEISEEEMTSMIGSLLSEEQKVKLEKEREIDLSIKTEDARFRANVYYQRGGLSAALRVVPNEIPPLDSLSLPEVVKSLTGLKQGFVLITGPTGQGKSTTVASMLQEINGTQQEHIVTIEDPIEYLIEPVKCMISQRELGFDTLSFEEALRSALRQDPNVVFIGEMRDLETISAALTIAETGHLVFSTLHTNSASQTVDRIIDAFPEGGKGQIRLQLASTISAIVSQRLLPMIGGGRIPACEILLANPAVRNSIREGKNFMVDNIIRTSAESGMISLEASLARLVRAGKVEESVAIEYALKPDEFTSLLRSRSIS